MSMVTCEHCDRFIDSDDEPGCFVDHPDGSTLTICENCQERIYNQQQEALMEDFGPPSLIEQQQAAYKIKHGLR
jgi:hypothetical protein